MKAMFSLESLVRSLLLKLLSCILSIHLQVGLYTSQTSSLRSLLSPGVCLSVRPSVGVDCFQTVEDIVRLLSRPISSIILAFLTPSAGTQFQGQPLQQGAQITRGKFCDFRLKSPFISETVRDRPIVAMER